MRHSPADFARWPHELTGLVCASVGPEDADKGHHAGEATWRDCFLALHKDGILSVWESVQEDPKYQLKIAVSARAYLMAAATAA